MVKLLLYDHEVTGSSPRNSLLQKCRERLRTKDPSGRTLPLTLRKQELRAPGLPLYIYFLFHSAIYSLMHLLDPFGYFHIVACVSYAFLSSSII